MDSKNHILIGFWLAAVCAIFLLWSMAFIHKWGLFDDALISMRYAFNWVHGQGLVWNPGERIEGYTNPLQVGVMAATTILFRDKDAAVLAIQIIGFLLVLVTGGLLAWGCIEEPVMVLGSVLSIYVVSYWALTGMETALIGVLLVAGCLISSSGRNPWRLGPIMVLLYLSRPDALLYGIVLLAFAYVWRTWSNGWKPLVVPLLLVASVVSLHVLWRAGYYGEWVPNTALLKLGHYPLSHRIPNGLRYVLQFLPLVAPSLVLAAISASKGDRLGVVGLSFFGVSSAYQIWIGGDAWLYWRFFAPILPLLVASAVTGGSDLCSALRVKSVIVLPCIMVALLFRLNGPFLSEAFLFGPANCMNESARQREQANTFSEILKTNATVAVSWAGTIPYFTGLKGIDLLGKCDRHIASLSPDLSGQRGGFGMTVLPGHAKYDLSYSLSLLPTLMQTRQIGTQDCSAFLEQNYVELRLSGDTYWLRKDDPAVNWDRLNLRQSEED